VVVGRLRNVRNPAWLGSVLLLTTFLAGAIAEANYLFAAAATTILYAVTNSPRPRDWLPFLPGLGIMALPIAPAPLTAQAWLVTGQIVLLAALLRRTPTHHPTGDRPRKPAALELTGTSSG
jgi:hypothetical protein